MSSLTSKLESLLQSRSVAGIECILSSDGIREINYVVLKKEKNKIITDSAGDKIQSLESLKTCFPVACPLFITLNGRGIIHRKFLYTEGESDAALLNKVLPAASLSDFYLQKIVADEGSLIVSVIRKSTADPVLNDLAKQGFHVLGCSLGAFAFQSIIPLLDNTVTSREIIVSGFKLSLGVNEISGFEPAEGDAGVPVKLTGGDEIKPAFVVPFSSAIHYFISQGREVLATIPSVTYESGEYRQKRRFNFTAGVAIAVFLAVLLANFLLFSSFSRKYNDYSARVSANQNMIQQYEKLKTEVEQRQLFLEKMGLLDASQTSFYADQVAKELPDAIQLTQMAIFPLEKKSNADEENLTFISKNILISGICKQSIELNIWMGILKKMNWVHEVNIVNFSQDKSENTGNFTIELRIK
jgi:Tfp pilus assembly protein PilN